MKTVLFLNEGYLGDITKHTRLQAVIFSMQNGGISGIENECLYNKDINYLTLWCLSKDVKEIYTQNIHPEDKKTFQKLGISIKTTSDVENDAFFKSFIFKE